MSAAPAAPPVGSAERLPAPGAIRLLWNRTATMTARADSASATRPSSISATNRQNWARRSRAPSPVVRASSMISDAVASRSAAPAGSHSACRRRSSTSATVCGSPTRRASRSAWSASWRRRGQLLLGQATQAQLAAQAERGAGGRHHRA
jgi:hypothetical protein